MCQIQNPEATHIVRGPFVFYSENWGSRKTSPLSWAGAPKTPTRLPHYPPGNKGSMCVCVWYKYVQLLYSHIGKQVSPSIIIIQWANKQSDLELYVFRSRIHECTMYLLYFVYINSLNMYLCIVCRVVQRLKSLNVKLYIHICIIRISGLFIQINPIIKYRLIDLSIKMVYAPSFVDTLYEIMKCPKLSLQKCLRIHIWMR